VGYTTKTAKQRVAEQYPVKLPNMSYEIILEELAMRNDGTLFTDKDIHKDVKTISKDKIIACRNHFRKINDNTPCKTCSVKLQTGVGNPFYGKKHTKESLIKMTKTLSGNPRKFSSSSKPEKQIEEIIKSLGFDVVRTYRVNEYICDIFLPKFNLIIEYNGDYWHCNPKKYEPDYMHPHKKKTSSQIWGEDRIRIDNIIKYDYNLEVVWESNFDKKNTIQNIIKKYERKN
jgi:G:T-mismatch repair DNA endonuclease (very short patch repair protein)